MLYQDRTLGRTGLWARATARLTSALQWRNRVDTEIETLSPHLRRDLGVYDGGPTASAWDYVWRK
jgi:hypothetical protein